MFERISEMIEDWSDDRVRDKFMMSSLKPTLILICLYLLTVKLILPAYMKNRPALNLDRAICYYNMFQVILSAYLVYLGFGSGWYTRFPVFKCRDIDRSPTDPHAIMAMNAVHFYYLAKLSEFCDTFFFILRKKFNQVSFLHIYHHASMPLNTWFLAKWTPGGSPTMAVGINSSVHVVMYSYYLLSGLGPHWQKYLWWKKYLTGFQLVQFTFGIIQITVTIIGECPTLQQFKPLFTFYIMYVASLLLLFSKFYHEAYNKNPNGKCSTTNGVAKRKKIS